MRPLYGRDHLDHVLGTFGLHPVLQRAGAAGLGAGRLRCRCRTGSTRSVQMLPGLYYPTYRLAIIVVALAVALLLYMLVMRTRLGMLIRAGASNREMVGALGVNIKLLYTLVFGARRRARRARRPDAGADPHRADRHGREHPDPRLRRHHHRRHRLDPRRLRRRDHRRPDRHHRPRVPARHAAAVAELARRGSTAGAGAVVDADLSGDGGRAGGAAARACSRRRSK